MPEYSTADTISSLEAARRELLASVEGMPGHAFERKLGDGWTVKDILAHVAMWDEMEFLEMRRSVRGGLSIFEHRFENSLIDRWNDIQRRLRSRLPLSQVREDMRVAREDIVQYLEFLAAGSPPPFVSTACAVQAKHDRDHAEQLRDWRKREGI